MKMDGASECPRGVEVLDIVSKRGGNSAQAVNSAAQFEVRGGCFSYSAGEENLCDINFSVSEPDILCILGANGAGKTTLMKCMLGLRPWSAGASYLDGVDIKRLRPKEFWRRVGYVPQAKLSSFVYTVREMVLLGRSAHMNELSMPKERDERAADEALALVGIAHLRDKLCSKISGGEYQMALIARALAAEPSLLVLDEPESNLDFKNQRRVLSTISTLCKERGIAAVINTHYPEHAMDISQRALLLMPDKSAVFGGTVNVLTEENLRRAFEIPVHIHRFKVGKRDYASILPLGESEIKQTERLIEMETRIAQIGIIVEDPAAAENINRLLHEYSDCIIGRMGMPYRERNISIISVIIDAPNEKISALSGKLGMFPGVSAKTVYSKI
ncbi:MAG: ATP-binding cassette domain-containing protein [Cloacibacillus porcorum]|uniref:TM1266 family iron-only hydrogenase system putative regulator n=1 Tax=Cloacibacillus porcorum TaxID=1197717 RepID=UPI002354D92D|nr:TM1266 family iron-only hydrogenase system putative regulator [Cloacibacillus porcorum]MCI5865472.1 ATP-binding cassette domain-containing protein [Cloacibacillus porcorum]